MNDIDWTRYPYGGDLYGEIHLAEGQAAPRGNLLPGLIACAVAAAAAAWLAERYGFPIVLLGLLIGLSLNFIARDAATHPGLDFAASTCLRLGIVALGLQVTFGEVSSLGLAGFGALLAIMAATIAAGLAGARLSGLTSYAGLLAGGSTAICGASAAMALYGTIGKARLSQAQFALTLVGVSLASALAVSAYPAIAGQLGFTDRQAGFLIGASVHDVAQAIGGGYAFSNEAGKYATIVKLARVALLAPVVALVSLWLSAAGGQNAGKSIGQSLRVPWFILGFLGVLALNSMIAVPAPLRTGALVVAKALLLLAVTATAMRTRMDLLMELGWRAITPVITATVVSFLAAMTAALLLF